MSQFKQWENIKLCQKLGKSNSEMCSIIKQVYVREALGHIAVSVWHIRFAQGRDSLEDDMRTGQPRTVRTEIKFQVVAMLVDPNHSQMVNEVVAAAAGISHGTCYKILSVDMNMSRIT
jgi:hypothetical protein